MNIPGFTAEASLYNGNARNQGTTETTFHGGIVRPVTFSDATTLDRPMFGRARRWGNCLKPTCRTVLIKDQYGQIIAVKYECGDPWKIAIC